MNTKKAIVRIFAIILSLAMVASLSACISSYNENPVVAQCGSIKLRLNQYQNLFSNTGSDNVYYQYLQYGIITAEQYRDLMYNELVTYGVQLDQLKVQNITLTDDEEAKVLVDFEADLKTYLEDTYGKKIDSSITGEQEKYDAQMELFVTDLKLNRTTFEEYRKAAIDSMRTSKRLEKMRDMTIAEIVATTESIKTYYTDNLKTTTTVADFYKNFKGFYDGTETNIPSFMPQPKVDEETEEEGNGIFSVLHLLVKFPETSSDPNATAKPDATATPEATTAPGTTPNPDGDDGEGAVSKIDQAMQLQLDTIESSIADKTMDQFINEFIFSADMNDDPGMLIDCYQYFGYMTHEDLISNYYNGFGYAACKLMYGSEWEPAEDATTEGAATADDKKKYTDDDLSYFSTNGGSQNVVKVETEAGIHYIVINTNDCFNMYDDEGKLHVVVYEDDAPVTDEEGIVTLNGHITEEQMAAIDESLSHAMSKEAAAEASAAATEAVNPTEKPEESPDPTVGPDTTEEPDATESPDPTEAPTATDNPEPTGSPNPEDGDDPDDDEEPEEEGPFASCKTIYDYYHNATLTKLQNEKYSTELSKWTENTRIVRHENLVKDFLMTPTSGN